MGPPGVRKVGLVDLLWGGTGQVQEMGEMAPAPEPYNASLSHPLNLLGLPQEPSMKVNTRSPGS